MKVIWPRPNLKRKIEKNGVHFWVLPQNEMQAKFWDSFETGAWEPRTFRVFDRFLKGNALVDIGGWIGPTTLYAAAKGCRVFVYECDPVAARTLEENIQLNDFKDRVSLFKYGLSVQNEEKDCYVRGKLGDSNTSVFQKDRRNAEERTEVVRLQFRSIAEELKKLWGESIDLVKCDIEGAEYLIFPYLFQFVKAHAQHPAFYLSLHPQFLGSSLTEFIYRREILGLIKDMNRYVLDDPQLPLEKLSPLKSFVRKKLCYSGGLDELLVKA